MLCQHHLDDMKLCTRDLHGPCDSTCGSTHWFVSHGVTVDTRQALLYYEARYVTMLFVVVVLFSFLPWHFASLQLLMVVRCTRCAYDFVVTLSNDVNTYIFWFSAHECHGLNEKGVLYNLRLLKPHHLQPRVQCVLFFTYCCLFNFLVLQGVRQIFWGF